MITGKQGYILFSHLKAQVLLTQTWERKDYYTVRDGKQEFK